MWVKRQDETDVLLMKRRLGEGWGGEGSWVMDWTGLA